MKRPFFAEKVYHFTEENALISAGNSVLVALSGGADSMALLHVLLHWPEDGLRVSAVHVHHGLRGEEADRDEAFVRQMCDRWDVPLTVMHVAAGELATREKIGTEEAARKLRYEALEQTLQEQGADRIATAHTASDQAETVLMHLIRGCGTNGLTGIPARRGAVVRPLLTCTREEIEDYCREQAIPFVTDSTNADTAYRRNFVRHRVIPLLHEMNPSLETAIQRTVRCAGQDEAYLYEEACRALDAGGEEDGVRLAAFTDQPPAIRLRMWREWYRRIGCHDPAQAYLVAMDRVAEKGFGSVTLPAGRTVFVENGRVTVADAAADAGSPYVLCAEELPFCFSLPGRQADFRLECRDRMETDGKIHKLFANLTADYDKIRGDLQIRNRLPGDTFHPAGRNVGKSLKDMLAEAKIPVFARRFYPVVCDEEGIVLVPGIACDERVRPEKDTKHFLVWCGDPVLCCKCGSSADDGSFIPKE